VGVAGSAQRIAAAEAAMMQRAMQASRMVGGGSSALPAQQLGGPAAAGGGSSALPAQQLGGPAAAAGGSSSQSAPQALQGPTLHHGSLAVSATVGDSGVSGASKEGSTGARKSKDGAHKHGQQRAVPPPPTQQSSQHTAPPEVDGHCYALGGEEEDPGLALAIALSMQDASEGGGIAPPSTHSGV
jgi:hypothetical protein